MTFLYFGYGSNMLTERLRARERCPSAKCIGIAEVTGYALEFSKPGEDGSGKATLGHVDDYRHLLAPRSAVRLPGECQP